VNGELRFRRVHRTALVGALALGLLSATLISRADAGATRLITLKDGPERLLTIRGSDRADSLTFDGTAPGTVTIYGSRDFTNERTDCTVGGTTDVAYCIEDDMRTIDVGLVEGEDAVRYGQTFQATGVDLTARGGSGDDDLRGSPFRDDLQGGADKDNLRGHDGRDRLDGGPDKDRCDGGPDDDRVRNCER
jgi:hypothetical protein